MSALTSRSTPPHLVVLGGGYAGLMAANRLAIARPRARVTLVDARSTFPHRIRLHEVASGRGVSDPPLARYLRPAIETLQARVEGIDAAAAKVWIRPAEGQGAALPFDGLVLALGSGYGGVPFPGLFTHALPVGDRASAQAIHGRLAGGAKAIVVIGGGLTGIEAAAEIKEAWPDRRVRLLSAAPLGAGLSPGGIRALRGALADLGIEVIEGEGALGAEGDGVLLAGGGRISADLVVWAGGGPASPIGGRSGLQVDGDGRICVDGALGVPGDAPIVAVGDSARALGMDGAPLAMTCNAAMPMGAHGARTLLDRLEGRAPSPFAFAWALRCISLGRRRGLVQRTHPDGAPRERILTGRRGAMVKGMILGAVPFFLALEARVGIPLYQWLTPPADAPRAALLGAPPHA